MAQHGNKKAQGEPQGFQAGPKWPRQALRTPKALPRTPKELSRWHNIAPGRPKEDPGQLNVAYSWPKIAPRDPQGRPKSFAREPNIHETAPGRGPEGPRWSQEEPKDGQRRPRKPNSGQLKTWKN